MSRRQSHEKTKMRCFSLRTSFCMWLRSIGQMSWVRWRVPLSYHAVKSWSTKFIDWRAYLMLSIKSRSIGLHRLYRWTLPWLSLLHQRKIKSMMEPNLRRCLTFHWWISRTMRLGTWVILSCRRRPRWATRSVNAPSTHPTISTLLVSFSMSVSLSMKTWIIKASNRWLIS